MRELDWHLVRELEQLSQRLQMLLEGAVLAPSLAAPQAVDPPVDVYETQDAVVVEVELPGIRPDQVRVELAGSELLIFGERADFSSNSEEQLFRIERPQGRFYRALPLPSPVSPPEEATLRGGVLVIRLPKVKSQAKTVVIGREDR